MKYSKGNITVELTAFLILWFLGTIVYLRVLSIVFTEVYGVYAVPYWLLLIIVFSKLYNVKLKELGFKYKVKDSWTTIFYPIILSLFLPLTIALFGTIFNVVEFNLLKKISLSEIAYTFIVYFIWAFGEEAIFRGYIFHRILMQGYNVKYAIFVNATLFTLVHALNIGFNVVAFFQLLIGGILLSLLVLSSGSLVSPTLFHSMWNYMLTLLGFPVSGNTRYILLKASTKNFEFIFGGSFGPEGGLAGLAVIILGLYITMTLFKHKEIFKT